MKSKLSSIELSERIIDLVRDHPELYDQRLKEYKDTELTSNIWKSIARLLTVDGISGDDVKTRWRSLRDLYVRKKKEQLASRKSGSAAKKGKCWAFLDILSFLDPYLQEASTDSNISL